jgi:hypothetical protein
MKKVTIGAKPQGSNNLSSDHWVAAREASEPIKRLTIDVPFALHKRIKSQCAMSGVNMANEIRDLLEKRFPEEYQHGGGSNDPSSN